MSNQPFLKHRGVQAAAIALFLHAAVYYAYPKADLPVKIAPLSMLPQTFGDWKGVGDRPMEPEVQEVLKASDSLTRFFVRNGDRQVVSLFVAFFESQRNGVSPHSPKNCLPGSGWVPTSNGFADLEIPGHGKITVNRYIVTKDRQSNVVYYWYQSHRRSVASEYAAKVWLVADAIRYRRSDTSLIRIVVPTEDSRVEEADRLAVDFIQKSFPGVVGYFPQ